MTYHIFLLQITSSGLSGHHLILAVILIFKHATFLRVANIASISALTRAELDYRDANIDSSIQKYLTASSQEHSVELFASFIMATDIAPSESSVKNPSRKLVSVHEIRISKLSCSSRTGAGSGEELRPGSMSQTACTPQAIEPLALALSPGHAATAGAEIAAGSTLPAAPMWEGCSNRPKPGSHASCTDLCEILALAHRTGSHLQLSTEPSLVSWDPEESDRLGRLPSLLLHAATRIVGLVMIGS
ncbi:hypothetical protein EDB92DRAFT_2101189 [Lactarius akahatsu]|uniref:Uncharacterized protein n=1 Tax=Lactarius akahatsu TaxID=416441 RepID=A0AAD4LMU6_9AGAM|nr:hypothetical protein EDB92DRAFT_2101189 [Lactarius akahatsu]